MEDKTVQERMEEFDRAAKQARAKKRLEKQMEKEAFKGTLSQYEAYLLLKQQKDYNEDVDQLPLKELQKVATKYYKSGIDSRGDKIKKTGTTYICTDGINHGNDYLLPGTFECVKNYIPEKRNQVVFKFVTEPNVIGELHHWSPDKGVYIVNNEIDTETVKSKNITDVPQLPVSVKEPISENQKFKPTKNSNEYGLVSLAAFLDTRRQVSDSKRPRAEVYPVKIRVTHKGNRLYYKTGEKVTMDEWMNLGIKTSKVWTNIDNHYNVIEKHIEKINEKGEFSFDELNRQLGRGKKDDVFSHFEAHIRDLRKKGLLGTATTYACAESSIRKYTGTDKLGFHQINRKWIEGYEDHMKKIKNKTTTRSIYLRALRSLINKAKKPDPFGRDKFEIQAGEGRQIALTKEQIYKLFNHNVVNNSTTHRIRDLFEFSYRCNGINFKDMIALKWNDNLINGQIVWKRAKTDRKNPKERFVHANITDKMQSIIDRRGNPESKYIFGYLNDAMTPEERDLICKNVIRLVNKHLNILGKELNLPHMSTYSARYSFASVLNTNKVQISAISELLGHSTILQTQTYVSKLTHEEIKEISKLLD